ncbi:MAG: GatB/YqeY domain-containing protein [Alphaproteobacteria bacterium]|nr:GatB/YqeY domain-containing protein [Alphaproteobacteria bacterium]
MLRARLNEELKTAMRAKQERELSTIRLILAALKDRDIAARGKGNYDGISEDEILQMFNGMIKQRRDSIALYEQGGRCELAQKEQDEIVIIQRFMPKQLSDAEVDGAIKEIIGALGAKSLKDMGKVMNALKEKFSGQMDFTRASALVKQHLSQAA